MKISWNRILAATEVSIKESSISLAVAQHLSRTFLLWQWIFGSKVSYDILHESIEKKQSILTDVKFICFHSNDWKQIDL